MNGSAGSGKSVLVVDDEPQIRRTLDRALTGHGYHVMLAEDGETALDLLATRRMDVVVLDLIMPGKDGFAVVREVRAWSGVPIVVLSARGAEEDKVTALDLGADDYLTKPFGIEELLARLRAVERRKSAEDRRLVVAGDATIDLARRLVTRGGEVVHLTPTEYSVLAAMAKHAGRVLTHRQLAEAVWGRYAAAFAEQQQQQRALRVYVNQLRGKLEAEPVRPRMILTESGVGYRLWPADSAGAQSLPRLNP